MKTLWLFSEQCHRIVAQVVVWLSATSTFTLVKANDTRAGADLGGGLTLNFEAQIFAAAATLLRDVGKISLGPPFYTNPGSAPAVDRECICVLPVRRLADTVEGTESINTCRVVHARVR